MTDNTHTPQLTDVAYFSLVDEKIQTIEKDEGFAKVVQAVDGTLILILHNPVGADHWITLPRLAELMKIIDTSLISKK